MADGEDFAFATPETIQLQRAYAKALLEHSLAGPPEGHSGNVTAVSPFGGIAQMSQALMGRMGADRAGNLDVQSRFTSANKSMPGLPGIHPGGYAEADSGPASAYADATSGQESGGKYDAVGPVMHHGSSAGDRAYGKYQVMGKNIPQWTYEALGYAMNPDQFLANPAAQEAVYRHKFGEYASKYGPEGAARAWYGGEGSVNHPGARDPDHPNAPTVGQYGHNFIQRLAASGGLQNAPGTPALAFSGEPQNVPSAPGSPEATALALSGGGRLPMTGGVRTGGGVAGPGIPSDLVPYRVPVSREQLIWSQASPYVSPAMKEAIPDLYYSQGQPVTVKDPYGRDVVIGRGGSQQLINPPVEIEQDVKGIKDKTIYSKEVGPDGRLIYRQIPKVGTGGAAPVRPATPPTEVPDEDVPALKFAPEEGAKTEGLPAEISKGPEAAAAERAGMLGKPPEGGPALPFAETYLPDSPAGASPTGQDMYDENMSMGQKAEWAQRYDLRQKAGEQFNSLDIQKVSKNHEAIQHQAIDSARLMDGIHVADRLLKDPRLQQLLGPGYNLKAGWQSFLTLLGNKDAEAARSLSDTFNKVIKSGIIGTLKSDYGGLGQIRNKEIELSEGATLSPHNTVEANMAVLEIAKRTAERNQMIGKIANLYMDGQRWDENGKPVKGRSNERPDYKGLSKVVSDYIEGHPLFDDKEKGPDGKTQMDHYLDIFRGSPKTEEKKVKTEGLPPGGKAAKAAETTAPEPKKTIYAPHELPLGGSFH